MPAATTECFSREIPRLLRLLRGKSVDADWPFTEWDWQSFADACEHHHLSALTFCRLNTSGRRAPPGLSEFLRKRFYEISTCNYRLSKDLIGITELFQDHGIPAVAYKGPAVAMLVYGDLALRQYHDIDLLVRREDVVNAVDLLTCGGFELAPFACRPESSRQLSRNHVIELTDPEKSYFVELHWRLGQDGAEAFCPDLRDMWDRIEPVRLPHGRVLTLCREDLFLALCFHGTKHRWFRLKWLVDIAEMLRDADSIDWSLVERTTSRRPLSRAAVSLAILLAQELMDAPVPAAAAAIIHVNKRSRRVYSALRDEISVQGCTTATFEVDLPRLEGSIGAWLSYLYRRYPKNWFVHAVVRIYPHDRAVLPLPEKLDFLYHLVRPLRLTAKHGVRLVRMFRKYWAGPDFRGPWTGGNS